MHLRVGLYDLGKHLKNVELDETNLIIENPKFIAVTNDIFEKEQKYDVLIFLKAHCLNEHEL